LGGLSAIVVVLRLARYYKISSELIWDLATYWILGAVTGARLYYVVYAWEYFREHLIEIPMIWNGGLAIHGLLLGGFGTLLLYTRQKKINFGTLADILAPAIALAQSCGRWGNYFNQELFGRPSNLPWSIPIDQLHRPEVYANFTHFHPTFLYESLGNFLVFTLLMIWHYRRQVRGQNKFLPGLIFVAYLGLYSLLRFTMEFLRVDYSPLIFGFRVAQIVSLLVVFFVGVFLIARRFQSKK
jgi:phosphatidylglycerol:prolipoprotein diacylglycerol transferase